MLIARESFEQPIRAELFGVERLEQHAASLAAAQETKSGRGRRLLARVEDNGRVLRESLVFRYLSTRYDVTVENPRHVSRGGHTRGARRACGPCGLRPC